MCIIVICLLFLCVLVSLRATNEISVVLKFGSSDLSLTFPATEVDAGHMAFKFCTEKGMQPGEQYDNCYSAVNTYLVAEVTKWHQKRQVPNQKSQKEAHFTESLNRNLQDTDKDKNIHDYDKTYEVLTVTLQIGDTKHRIEYNYETESAQASATVFCKKNRKLLGVTKSTLHNCVSPVEAELQSALSKHLVDKKTS